MVELVDFHALIKLYRLYNSDMGRIYGFAARADLIGAVAALVGVLLFDTLPGLFIGIGISVLLLVYRASRPYVAVLGRIEGRTGRDARSTTKWDDPLGYRRIFNLEKKKVCGVGFSE